MQYAINDGLVVYERYDYDRMPDIPGAEYIRVPDSLAHYFQLGEPDPRPGLPQNVLDQITGRLLTAFEFKNRFTAEEQAAIMTSPQLAPLALHVLTAPNGVDVTDATAQQARAALEQSGWSVERLDEIFSLPET